MPRVYVDTNIFVAAYEKNDVLGSDLSRLFEVFRAYPQSAVTSELTLAELTIRADSPRRFYYGLLVANTFIDLRPVTRSILMDLGSFREASHRAVKLPDAIHGVTAVQAQCDYILTADRRFSIPPPMTRLNLDHEGLTSLIKLLDG